MFKYRSNELELLDNETIPKADLYLNLQELAFINKYLGGHQTILRGLQQFKNVKSIVEIGSGGGDNLRAIQKWNPSFQLSGVDLKQDCIDFSKTNSQSINFYCSDYQVFNKQADVIFNSLFCHHFKDEALVEMFKWMHENSKLGFIIGDLHRHWLAYYSIKSLSALFSKSYLLKNDAPLSVKRGFKKSELVNLLEKAGIKDYKIQWVWAFRYLIVIKK